MEKFILISLSVNKAKFTVYANGQHHGMQSKECGIFIIFLIFIVTD